MKICEFFKPIYFFATHTALCAPTLVVPTPTARPVVTIVSTLHRSVVMRPSDRQHEPVKQSTKNVCLFGGIQFMHKCTVANPYSCIDMSFPPGC